MGKIRGHHRHGHHRGFGFGMTPHFGSNDSSFDQRDPDQSDFGQPHLGGLNDPRMCFTMRGHSMRGRGFHHMFGRHFEMPSFYGCPSSSDSSSDSDSESKSKHKKRRNQHFNHWHQMQHLMSNPNSNKILCTLCWGPTQPFAETEVLECGHLYHRKCLKELFVVSESGGHSDIFCTQCRQQIDAHLVSQLKTRFNTEPNTEPNTESNTELNSDSRRSGSFTIIEQIED